MHDKFANPWIFAKFVSISCTENLTRIKGGVKRESTADDSLARVNCLIKYSLVRGSRFWDKSWTPFSES